ncbi:MAG TPA: 30S ribosomal protein S9 [archaeon]|jgi:small subunit ribosomal protein S9|nr:30S ribosomal protein S9 [archaeon]HRT02328.1 30S ribosomal protein S9 [Candidatus Diapherotrites archaeon]
MVKVYNAQASRKNAKARITVKPGTGVIRINNYLLEAFTSSSPYKKELVLEPAHLIPEEFNKFDYDIIVNGGGIMAQLQAARSAIAKGLLKANHNKKSIKDKFLEYDKHLLVDDVRRQEPKKQLGRGARKKKQKSKR